MARLPQLFEIAQLHNLKIVSIDDLISYRMRTERIVNKELELTLDSKYGTLEICAYQQLTSGDIHLAIKKGNWNEGEVVPVRVQSSTEPNDILGALFSQSEESLHKSFEIIEREGKGVFLYIQQSEKGHSMLQRLRVLKAQKEKNTTAQGFMDRRDFGVGAQILRDMKVCKIKLITHTPLKRIGLQGYGLEIVENVLL